MCSNTIGYDIDAFMLVEAGYSSVSNLYTDLSVVLLLSVLAIT